MAQIYSLQLERSVLSGLLKYPKIFPDVDQFLTSEHFYSRLHRVIYSTITQILSKSDPIDPVLVANKISDQNISFEDNIDPHDYLDNLKLGQITQSAAMEACKELVKITVRRNISTSLLDANNFVKGAGNEPLDSIIAGCDERYYKTIASLTMQDEPVDLFGDIEEKIMERANSPVEEIGLITPYPYFNRMFGGLRAGNGIYAIVSRAKQGKSSILLNMAMGVCDLNNCPVLFLDTEMTTEVNQFRSAAAVTDINMTLLEKGKWARNPELAGKIKQLDKLKKYRGKIWHMKVANIPVERVASIIRRWYYKHVGRNGNAMVIYDYIKITGEKVDRNYAEHQAIGEKINRLNEVGGELGIPIFSAMQMNRSAENGVDDSSAIALSDRLSWFAAFVAIFRRKRLEELSQHGEEFGTHMLIPLATRFQGEDAAGHLDYVKIPIVDNGKGKTGNSDGKQKFKYEQNFINYDVTNFNVEERHTYQQIIDSRMGKFVNGKQNVEQGIL